MTRARESIAVVGVGPVGTGEHGRGIPAFVSCLEELSKNCAITVYSLLEVNPRYTPRSLRVRYLPFRTPYLRLDLFLLSLMILVDHFVRRFDVLHAVAAYPAGWICTLLSRMLRIPCVVTLLGEEVAHLPAVDFGDLRNPRKARKMAWACANARALVALTKFQAQGLVHLGIAGERARIVPFGVDIKRFGAQRKELVPPLEFLHVAYAHPVKGIETLLETFRLVSSVVPANLTIVGANHIGGRTQRLATQMCLSDRITLIPPLPNKSLADLYEQAHFLLHTSWYESQAVVINEAMACGVVVCATRVGIAADLGSEFCVVAEVGDAQDLAEQILSIARDERRYAALRDKAWAWSRDHDVGWTALAYRDIYSQLIS